MKPTLPATLIIPETPAQMAAFRALNWDYRAFLLTTGAANRDFILWAYPEAKYTAILNAAETDNRPPRGQMRLALLDDTPVGCGTVQTLPTGEAEIKRVYIAPAARGTGLGRKMTEQLITDCRTLGVPRILLDTGRVLTAAQALYDSLGFVRRGPYQDLPLGADEILVFYEMQLDGGQ